MSPVTAFVRTAGGNYVTTNEAAVLIGTTTASLRYWMSQDWDNYGPRNQTDFGKVTVYLWSPEDIARVRATYDRARAAQPGRFMGRPGVVRLWSDLERLDRSRRTARATYHRRASRRRAEVGDTDGAIAQMAIASGITKQLRAESRKRRREIKAKMRLRRVAG